MACVALLILYVSFVAAANPRLLAVISSKDGTAVAEPLKPRTSACTEINAEGGSVPYMVCLSQFNTQYPPSFRLLTQFTVLLQWTTWWVSNNKRP